MNYINDQNNQQSKDLESQLARSLFWRIVFICLAWLCIFLAILGIFIPGLPTVDFLLLAVMCAAKGSEKLHRWFLRNKYIGPIIHDWKTHRRIPQKAKYMSTISMSIAAGLMIWSIPHLWFVYTAIFCMICVLGWMWRN